MSAVSVDNTSVPARVTIVFNDETLIVAQSALLDSAAPLQLSQFVCSDALVSMRGASLVDAMVQSFTTLDHSSKMLPLLQAWGALIMFYQSKDDTTVQLQAIYDRMNALESANRLSLLLSITAKLLRHDAELLTQYVRNPFFPISSLYQMKVVFAQNGNVYDLVLAAQRLSVKQKKPLTGNQFTSLYAKALQRFSDSEVQNSQKAQRPSRRKSHPGAEDHIRDEKQQEQSEKDVDQAQDGEEEEEEEDVQGTEPSSSERTQKNHSVSNRRPSSSTQQSNRNVSRSKNSTSRRRGSSTDTFSSAAGSAPAQHLRRSDRLSRSTVPTHEVITNSLSAPTQEEDTTPNAFVPTASPIPALDDSKEQMDGPRLLSLAHDTIKDVSLQSGFDPIDTLDIVAVRELCRKSKEVVIQYQDKQQALEDEIDTYRHKVESLEKENSCLLNKVKTLELENDRLLTTVDQLRQTSADHHSAHTFPVSPANSDDSIDSVAVAGSALEGTDTESVASLYSSTSTGWSKRSGSGSDLAYINIPSSLKRPSPSSPPLERVGEDENGNMGHRADDGSASDDGILRKRSRNKSTEMANRQTQSKS